LEDADAGGRRAVEHKVLAIGLGAELHPADIPDTCDAPARLVVDLDDDALEVGCIVEAAGDVDRILEILPFGAGGIPMEPAVTSWLCCWIALITSLGVRPRACNWSGSIQMRMALLAGAIDVDVAHARQARELVLQIDDAVVREEQAVVTVVGDVSVTNIRTGSTFSGR